jgi:hypothetical protein
MLSVGAVYLLADRFFSRRAALLAAALYGFSFFALADYTALGEAESFMNLPLILAFILYSTTDSNARSYSLAAASGLMLGLVVAFKLSSVPFVLGLPLMEIFLRTSDWSLKGAVKRLSLAAVAFLGVQSAWVLYLIVDGSWSAFVDIQRNYTLPYNGFRWAHDEPYIRAVMRESSIWLKDGAYLTLPAWAAIVLALFRSARGPVYFLGSMVLIAWLVVLWQGKMFHYHWITAMPFLAGLAGYSCASLLDLAQARGRRVFRSSVALLMLAFLVLGLGPILRTYDNYGVLIDRATGRLSAIAAEYRYDPELISKNELVEFLNVHSGPNDAFIVYGLWPAPYVELERPLPTRFVASHGLRADWTPVAWREEFIADLIADPPRFIILAAGDHQPWLTGNDMASDWHACYGFPEFRALLDQRYRVVFANDIFIIYDRDAPAHLVEAYCL